MLERWASFLRIPVSGRRRICILSSSPVDRSPSTGCSHGQHPPDGATHRPSYSLDGDAACRRQAKMSLSRLLLRSRRGQAGIRVTATRARSLEALFRFPIPTNNASRFPVPGIAAGHTPSKYLCLLCCPLWTVKILRADLRLVRRHTICSPLLFDNPPGFNLCWVFERTSQGQGCRLMTLICRTYYCTQHELSDDPRKRLGGLRKCF